MNVFRTKMLVLIACSALIVACGGGKKNNGSSTGSSSTTNTSEQAKSVLVTALNSGDIDQALTVFSKSEQARKRVAFEKLGASGMKQLVSSISKATIVEQTDTKVVYKTTISKNGSPSEVRFTFYNVNGTWVVGSL